MGDAESQLSDREMADLSALADGTLPAERRPAVEAWVATSADLQEVVDRQRRSLAATQAAATEPMPPALRTTVEAQIGERRRDRSRRLVPRLAFGGAAAAVATVALIVTLGGGAGEPSVAEAAELTTKPPSGPAPTRLEGSRTELAADVEGVRFPDFRRAYGWRPAGVREDTVDGREATVVYYRKGERRIAYAIVSGDGLAPPSDAAQTTRGGVTYRSLHAEGRPGVTWERLGHTCVMTGTASNAELLALASY
jgi:hypothetical protein